MVGGATCLALGPEDAYVTPTMARPGEAVVVTKGRDRGDRAVRGDLPRAPGGGGRRRHGRGRRRAVRVSMTVVPEAVLAREFGLRDAGVTSMHDATEGGVLGGLLEVATASDVGMRRAGPDPSGPRSGPSASRGHRSVHLDQRGHTDRDRRAGPRRRVRGGARRGGDRGSRRRRDRPGERRPDHRPGGNGPLEHPGLDPFWGRSARGRRRPRAPPDD